MGKKIKTVKIKASSTNSWLVRPIYQKGMDKTIEKWISKGWKMVNTTPITGRFGKTTHYLVTFEKD